VIATTIYITANGERARAVRAIARRQIHLPIPTAIRVRLLARVMSVPRVGGAGAMAAQGPGETLTGLAGHPRAKGRPKLNGELAGFGVWRLGIGPYSAPKASR
jgi:hypothetical protein